MLYYDFKTMPEVVMTGKTAETRGWSHEGRSIDHNLVVFFHSGECVFDINGQIVKYKAGDIALVPKNTFYKPRTQAQCEYTFFHFDGTFTESEAPSKDNSQDLPELIYGKFHQSDFRLPFDFKMSVDGDEDGVELLLSKCVNAPLSSGENVPLLLSTYFTELMICISKANFGSKKHYGYPKAVNNIISFIQENYRNKISLDDVCSSINVSKQYCMRVFKKHVGKTVADYLLEVRMKHALYLLRWTYMNVSETSNYLGFSDVAYFSKVFKKYYGVSPSTYFE